ncbi:hypothetical protein ACFC09_18815 [Streptomyces sp. NPDC056161]|uniref:hypothetical protein n=1 Tax=Streptomyces sp. NPDC056161 TaxID=3345732 RepID=UPI0035DBDB92
MLDRQVRNARWWRERLTGPGQPATGSELITARIAWSEREYDYTSANRSAFAQALR